MNNQTKQQAINKIADFMVARGDFSKEELPELKQKLQRWYYFWPSYFVLRMGGMI